MKRLLIGILIGSVLSLSIGWGVTQMRDSEAAPAAQTSIEAEWLIRDASYEIAGSGGYGVFILRNYGGDDIGLVTWYDSVGMPSYTYLCLEERFGWDCSFWRW
jgi:hypothetical protein